MPSVNQLAASIKLTEVWKSLNIENYPFHLEPNNRTEARSERSVQPGTTRSWNQDAKTAAEKESLSRSAAKLWNSLPTEIKNLKTLVMPKGQSKFFVSHCPCKNEC